MHQKAENLYLKDNNPNSVPDQIIDARDKKDFDGAGDGKSSNIKGAINLPFDELLNKDGTFKSDAEIKEVFKTKNISTEKDSYFMC